MRCLFSVFCKGESLSLCNYIVCPQPPFPLSSDFFFRFVFTFLWGFSNVNMGKLAVLPFQWFLLQTKFSASVFIQLSAPAVAFQTKVRVSDTLVDT